MTTTITTEDLANVPHPAGAVQVHEWFNDDQPVGAVVDHVYEGTRRWFVGISRLVSCPDVPDIKVWIDGFQYADGHADRYIMVDNVHTDHPLDVGVGGEATREPATEVAGDSRDQDDLAVSSVDAHGAPSPAAGLTSRACVAARASSSAACDAFSSPSACDAS